VPPPIQDRVLPDNVPQQAPPQAQPAFEFPPLVQVTNHIRSVNVRNYYGSQSTTNNNM
jgi:hypothetical protein